MPKASRSTGKVRGSVMVHREGDPPFLKTRIAKIFNATHMQEAQREAEKRYKQSTFGTIAFYEIVI